MMEKVGYDAATGSFRADSIIAAGTTRQLAEAWWPELDAAGIAEKTRMLDNDYTHMVTAALHPLLPLDPLLAELRAMGMRLGVGTNDSHVSARSHMSHAGVLHHFDDIIARRYGAGGQAIGPDGPAFCRHHGIAHIRDRHGGRQSA